MAQAQYLHLIVVHAIAKNIRRHDSHFPSAFANIASARRKLRETLRQVDQPFRDAYRRCFVEACNIRDDAFQVFDRCKGPDDTSQLVADFWSWQTLTGNQGFQPADHRLVADDASFAQIGLRAGFGRHFSFWIVEYGTLVLHASLLA